MPPTSNILRASRPLFRSGFTASQARTAFHRTNGFRPSSNFRQGARRFQSTTAGTENTSWFKRMWDSPIGLKTVHFWAPVMKWALVIAGISDFARPAEKLSFTQNLALTATGLIWTRWCLIIKPKNYLLAAVNFFLGCVGVIQVSRIVMYNQSHKGLPSTTDEVKEEVKEGVKEVKAAIKS